MVVGLKEAEPSRTVCAWAAPESAMVAKTQNRLRENAFEVRCIFSPWNVRPLGCGGDALLGGEGNAEGTDEAENLTPAPAARQQNLFAARRGERGAPRKAVNP